MDYEKKLEEAKRLYETANADQRYVLESLFWELAESEDEKTRKRIIALVNAHGQGMYKDDMLAWLEKQGEQKSYSWKPTKEQFEALNYAYNSCSDTERGNYYEGILETLIEDLHRLKKQGEQKPTTEIKSAEESLGIDSDTYNKIVDECIYGDDEQKPAKGTKGNEREIPFSEQESADKVKPKFKAGDKVIGTISNIPYYITEVCNGYYLTDTGCIIMFNAQNNFELSNQNPHEWSEEDEQYVKDTLALLSFGCSIHTITQVQDWLKSLKDRVQPQQEWSEEDEKKLNRIYTLLAEAANKHAFSTTCRLIGDKECVELQDFLKSLRPRNTWKPSEEQITWLYRAADDASKDSRMKQILNELLSDLKKLRK